MSDSSTGQPCRPMGNYAGWFTLVGLVLTIGPVLLSNAPGPFYGAGDGAGHANGASPLPMVLPFSSYFICGVVAAVSTRRNVRVVAAIIAHSAPLISFLFVSPVEEFGFVGLLILTAAAFAHTWFRLLKKEEHELSAQPIP